MRLSIIIPTLNEAANLQHTLDALQGMRRRGHEVILVDGGSHDATRQRARPLVDRVIESAPGRAMQMNAGERQAQGDVLWFLHADTRVPENADQLMEKILRDGRHHWGRFNVRLSGGHGLFRVIEFMMNLRSCLTGIATGDQGIFIKRCCFQTLDGYPSIALMEDIEFSRRLNKHYGRPACVATPLITSSRRWERQGIIKTTLLMWRLRLAYFFGARADELKRLYRDNG
jgi:rSAM/selenodomain-associated transferase 2